ncbi:NAD(P)H-dependent flavin oxidoreductase [Lysobacter sp. TAF61]|uniref:NAD(P)H-dependent flavin oxidoreductase n=1 Tax=Lysobacter sp. TAF61 TaxID=3233072 RepID=UPI003F9C76D8
MWHDNDFTRRLGLRYPIVQGPFGGGLSSVDLMVAVSDAGGLGSFGAHHLAPEKLGELTQQIRARTQRPFALNLWVSNQDPGGDRLTSEQFADAIERFRPYYDALGMTPPAMPERYGQRFDDQVQAMLDARPPVMSFVFGIPSADILAECRRREIATMGTITTLDEAIAMDQAGVDVIVTTGFEAGGHRVSFLRSAEDSLTGTFALIPQVVDRVATPVIAAGGIADGRGVAAAMTLGAQGVQIGTAFLACEESGTNGLHRAMLFTDEARYTALTRAFSGRLARGIRNRFVDEWEGVAALPYPIQNWFTGTFKAMAAAQGRGDMISLWAGQGAPLLKHRRAQALFAALVQEAGALLR